MQTLSRISMTNSSKTTNMAILNYQTMFEESLQEEDLEAVKKDERVAELLKREEEKWAQNLELAKQQAFEEGHKQAWLEAEQKFENDIKENTAFYQRIIRRMGSFWLEQKEELMQALMTTGFEVAKEIIDHVQLSEEFIEQQHRKILELLHKVEVHSKPVLQVSQEDESRILEMVKGSNLPIQVSIEAGQGFNKGEFILDTEHERWIGVHRLITDHFQTHVHRV